MSDKKFIDGLIVKAPRDGAPDYIVGKLSMKREQLIAWLQQQSGEWVNADIKIAQSGNWYAQVDDWKSNRQGGGNAPQRPQSPAQQYDQARDQRLRDHQRNTPADDFADDDIPF